MKEKITLAVIIFISVFGLLVIKKPFQNAKPIYQEQHQQQNPAPVPPLEKTPATPKIDDPIPEYLTYPKLVKKLGDWMTAAPDLAHTGTIGDTTRGFPIVYIKVGNKYKKNKPKVLVTACVHGNEPHSTTTVMGYIGTLLSKYGTDPEVTMLLDSREICFIPVLSPDSYPVKRQVDGVDPNRDYINGVSKPIQHIRKFFVAEGFAAALSGHTWGRVYLTPFGDTTELCKNEQSIADVMKSMTRMSGYKNMRAVELYKGNGGVNIDPIRYGNSDYEYQLVTQPIYGTEVDWYYRTGDGKGRPTFAIVCEFGTHQRIPTLAETENEFKKTYNAFLYFCKVAPEVQKSWVQ